MSTDLRSLPAFLSRSVPLSLVAAGLAISLSTSLRFLWFAWFFHPVVVFDLVRSHLRSKTFLLLLDRRDQPLIQHTHQQNLFYCVTICMMIKNPMKSFDGITDFLPNAYTDITRSKTNKFIGNE